MEKLNIAELLKDCPKGMELDCTMYEDVYFDYVDELNIIHCYIQQETHKTSIIFSRHGTPNSDVKSKCVIFPKGKTTWEGFQRPFKDGDVLIGKSGEPFIFKRLNNNEGCYSYCGINSVGQFKLESDDWTFANSLRFATEEEKQELFDVIKANGYKWNPETKTLEKLKVNRFDISILKPFDKVLVRDSDEIYWSADFYSHHLGKDKNYQFRCICMMVKQCIPYKGNEHLLGTNDNCDDFYKTWE